MKKCHLFSLIALFTIMLNGCQDSSVPMAIESTASPSTVPSVTIRKYDMNGTLLSSAKEDLVVWDGQNKLQNGVHYLIPDTPELKAALTSLNPEVAAKLFGDAKKKTKSDGQTALSYVFDGTVTWVPMAGETGYYCQGNWAYFRNTYVYCPNYGEWCDISRAAFYSGGYYSFSDHIENTGTPVGGDVVDYDVDCGATVTSGYAMNSTYKQGSYQYSLDDNNAK